MKNNLFCSLTAAGVLALFATGYAANAANLPRHHTATVIATAAPDEKLVLHFERAARISMDGSGRLEVIDTDGMIRRYRPSLFQIIDGKRKVVAYSCHVVGADHVELKAVHPDPSAPLELAPVHPITATS